MSSFIDEIELSVRAGNVLRKHFPDMDLDRFMSLTKEDLMCLPHFGSRSWREVKEVQDHFRRLQAAEAQGDKKPIRDIRVIEYIDTETGDFSQHLFQIDIGGGWQNVRCESTTNFSEYLEMAEGLK